MVERLASAAAVAFRTPFGGCIRIEPNDGDAAPPAVTDDAPKAADEGRMCVWRASADTLARIFEGERLLGSAYVSGRLSISGDMSVMARLQLERPARG